MDTWELAVIIGGGFIVFVALILIILRLCFAGRPVCCKPRPLSGFKITNRDIMKAAVHDGHGPPSILRVSDKVPVPSCFDDELLIQTVACSLNPVDFKFLQGSIAMAEPILGIARKNTIPGFDVAGVVVGVGRSVNRGGKHNFKVGDRVFAMHDFVKRATLAEFVTVPAERCAYIPHHMTFNQAASLPLVTQTGIQALYELSALQPGQRVLILGGAGGTGTIAIQLAKAKGCWVATTASPRNVELVKNVGADLVINYREQDWADVLADRKVNVVANCVGGPQASAKAGRVLLPKGSYVSIVGEPGGACRLVRRWCSDAWGCGHKYHVFTCFGTGPRMQEVARMADQRLIRPVVDKVFPLDRIVDAFEYITAGKAQGKVVVEVWAGKGESTEEEAKFDDDDAPAALAAASGAAPNDEEGPNAAMLRKRSN